MTLGKQAFIAAAARERLKHLPGISPPGWLTYLYYERSLVMAILLVGMCLYATLTSPAATSAPEFDTLTAEPQHRLKTWSAFSGFQIGVFILLALGILLGWLAVVMPRVAPPPKAAQAMRVIPHPSDDQLDPPAG